MTKPNEYFHTDNPRVLYWLSQVCAEAERRGLSLRLKTDSDNTLKVKMGHGMWTAPFDSTPDSYRDA